MNADSSTTECFGNRRCRTDVGHRASVKRRTVGGRSGVNKVRLAILRKLIFIVEKKGCRAAPPSYLRLSTQPQHNYFFHSAHRLDDVLALASRGAVSRFPFVVFFAARCATANRWKWGKPTIISIILLRRVDTRLLFVMFVARAKNRGRVFLDATCQPSVKHRIITLKSVARLVELVCYWLLFRLRSYSIAMVLVQNRSIGLFDETMAWVVIEFFFYLIVLSMYIYISNWISFHYNIVTLMRQSQVHN